HSFELQPRSGPRLVNRQWRDRPRRRCCVKAMTKSIRIFLSTTLVGVVMTFTGPAYAGGNGKGGENVGAQSAAAQSGSATSPGKSGDAPGQAKKSDETSSSSSVAASTQPSAAAATGSAGAKPGQAAKSGPAKAATKPAGRGNSTNTSTSPGLKPTKSTQRNFYTPAGSSSTKRYGNGQTAGQIAIKHGAQPTTKLYSPG